MEKRPPSRIEWGRIVLRGWRTDLVMYAVVALIICIPAGCAFFAYAEGGTSLWGAVGYSAAIYGGFALCVFWGSMPLRRKR